MSSAAPSRGHALVAHLGALLEIQPLEGEPDFRLQFVAERAIKREPLQMDEENGWQAPNPQGLCRFAKTIAALAPPSNTVPTNGGER